MVSVSLFNVSLVSKLDSDVSDVMMLVASLSSWFSSVLFSV